MSHTNASMRLNTKRWKLAAILGTLAAFAPLSIDMYLPALPHIASELQTTPSFVQLSLTFFMLGLALGQLFIGPLSDIRGRRTPLLIGLAIYSVASLLCNLHHRFGSLSYYGLFKVYPELRVLSYLERSFGISILD